MLVNEQTVGKTIKFDMGKTANGDEQTLIISVWENPGPDNTINARVPGWGRQSAGDPSMYGYEPSRLGAGMGAYGNRGWNQPYDPSTYAPENMRYDPSTGHYSVRPTEVSPELAWRNQRE